MVLIQELKNIFFSKFISASARNESVGLASLGKSILGYGIERIADSSTNGLERSEYSVGDHICVGGVAACWVATGITCFWSWLISPAPCAKGVAGCLKITFACDKAMTIAETIDDAVNGRVRSGKSNPFRKYSTK